VPDGVTVKTGRAPIALLPISSGGFARSRQPIGRSAERSAEAERVLVLLERPPFTQR
jgi:hypothetical protein